MKRTYIKNLIFIFGVKRPVAQMENERPTDEHLQ